MRDNKRIYISILGVAIAIVSVITLASVTSYRVPSRDDRLSGTQERIEVNKWNISLQSEVISEYH